MCVRHGQLTICSANAVCHKRTVEVARTCSCTRFPCSFAVKTFSPPGGAPDMLERAIELYIGPTAAGTTWRPTTPSCCYSIPQMSGSHLHRGRCNAHRTQRTAALAGCGGQASHTAAGAAGRTRPLSESSSAARATMRATYNSGHTAV